MRTDTCRRTVRLCWTSDAVRFVRLVPDRPRPSLSTCKHERPRWGGPCIESLHELALRRGWYAAVPVLHPRDPDVTP